MWLCCEPRYCSLERHGESHGEGPGITPLDLPWRNGNVLVSQPPDPGPIKRGMYKSSGGLTLQQLPLLAGLILDTGLVITQFFFSFPFYFSFHQGCQVMLAWYPIKPHNSDVYNCVGNANINRIFVLCVPINIVVYACTLSVISP